MLSRRLVVVVALVASTLTGVGADPAQAADPTLPQAPIPEGRPWSGAITVLKDFSTQGWSSMRWAATNVSEGAYEPSWSCSGSEIVRLTTTGDGVLDGDPGVATVPVTGDVAGNESCQGTYTTWTDQQCAASATWATSGSVEGNMGFSWVLHDWTDPSQGGSWVMSGGSWDPPAVQMSLTDPCGFVELVPYGLEWLVFAHGVQEVSGIPPASLTTGTQMSGSYVDTVQFGGGGFGDSHDEVQTIDYDFVYTGPPPDLCGGGIVTPTDADGDRLPDTYEYEVSGTNPANADTDGDCFGDAREVASGSSPINMAQTPDTLPSGVAPGSLVGRGHAGITCGTTRFRWVTPSLQDLGVGKDRKGCVMLLSNAAANAVLDYSIEYGPSITATLQRLTRPHLLEINGQDAIDWVAQEAVDRAIWDGTRLVVKKSMLKGLNLIRLNSIFTVAEVGALSGVVYGTLWGVNQVRNRNACIQIRLGGSSNGSSRFSWSLVYSAENLTNAGLADGLHRSSVWKRHPRRFLPDDAVRRSTNLVCKQGRPVATGAGAGEVFEGATSFVF